MSNRVSKAYWILPIIFNWLGGFTAWLLLKDKDRNTANKMLLLGLIILGIEIFAIIGFAIFYVYT